MIDYYTEFVKPREVVKDINYFYDQIITLICNNFFGKYLYNKRKRLKVSEYAVENFLADNGNITRLRFRNDLIVVTFKVSKFEKGQVKITPPIYKNYRLDNVVFNINIVITPQEEKNKIIYTQNMVFQQLRKYIHEMNEYYVSEFRKTEEKKFKTIFNRLNKLNKSYYSDWNRLIKFVMDCVSPTFNKNLHKFDDVVKGFQSDVLTVLYKMIHQTQFFQMYSQYRQIKYKKFIKSLIKECLDDDEIIQMSNSLAWCFGHKNEDYDECISFIQNVINHFNTICYVKEMKINSYITQIWETYHQVPS
jgi:hypothetical protein